MTFLFPSLSKSRRPTSFPHKCLILIPKRPSSICGLPLSFLFTSRTLRITVTFSPAVLIKKAYLFPSLITCTTRQIFSVFFHAELTVLFPLICILKFTYIFPSLIALSLTPFLHALIQSLHFLKLLTLKHRVPYQTCNNTDIFFSSAISLLNSFPY